MGRCILIKMLIKNKKSQVWGLDLIIASIIFMAGIIVFYLYAINFSTEAEESLDTLFNDGNFISNVLLSEGVPAGWSGSNVSSPGLVSQSKINETKLEGFYSLVGSDYQKSKRMLNTKFDFYVYFTEKMSINSSIIDGIGKSGVNRTNILESESLQNIVKIERFTIYNNKPTQLNVYVWN
ncbi:hypothetical protein HYT26_03065 [Candidatus Pacearchaeota archaeon]|nr:hypothetical protein [Candidatus Pacearchaeota archaeon]